MYSSMTECTVLKQHEEKIVIFCASGINRASVETNESFYLSRLLLRADWGKCLMGSCFWNHSITIRERKVLSKIEWAIMKRRLVAPSVNGSFCQSEVFSIWTSTGESAVRAAMDFCLCMYFVTSDLVCVDLCVWKTCVSWRKLNVGIEVEVLVSKGIPL